MNLCVYVVQKIYELGAGVADFMAYIRFSVFIELLIIFVVAVPCSARFLEIRYEIASTPFVLSLLFHRPIHFHHENFLFFLVIAFLTVSCKKEVVSNNLVPSEDFVKVPTGGLRSTQIGSLADLYELGSGTGQVLTVPSEYTLSMQGIWNYTSAYLYKCDTATATIHEVYVFDGDNEQDYQDAGDDCDMDYYANGDGYICCNGNGNKCKLTITESGVCIKTCLPANYR